MRLRRETGDFQIVVKPGEQEGEYTVNSIRPGLSAEDLIGEVVFNQGSYEAVAFAAPSENKIRLDLREAALLYDPATGEIVLAGS